jgi:hypothetical protein
MAEWTAESDSGDLLEALRFVRAMFDDPIDDVTFEWSEAKGLALGGLVVEVLKANAVLALGSVGEEITEAAIDAYVSRFLDGMITGQMALGAP